MNSSNKTLDQYVYLESEVFIGRIAQSRDMVSRSLEKMILIAVGLSTAVVFGVPVLLYTIETLTIASDLEQAQFFAERVNNITEQVETGAQTDLTIEINVPLYVTVTAEYQTLTITFERQGATTKIWEWTYSHEVDLQSPTTSGPHFLRVRMVSGTIEITFTPVSQ